MANFRYRLQTLLDRKIERRKELEKSLVDRQKELAAEQRALTEMEEAQAALEATLVEARRKLLGIEAGESGYALQLRTHHLRGLRADVEAGQGAVFAQRLRVGDFEDRVAEARKM